MNHNFEQILRYLNRKHGFDFSENRYSTLERKINDRMQMIDIQDARSYIQYLDIHSDELNLLIDCFTITVSRFFRNTLTYEYIAKRILPGIITEKIKIGDPSLRIWSAGCAQGEEPYSIAILINEILEKNDHKFDVNIFATDINREILKKAEDGIYQIDDIKDVKFGLLCKYFTIQDKTYILNHKIKKWVDFSFYDIIDPKTYVPSGSVFGGFDLVLCRNLLIYFQAERQKIIFDKLYRSLNINGCLILGKAERIPSRLGKCFFQDTDYYHIYRKCS